MVSCPSGQGRVTGPVRHHVLLCTSVQVTRCMGQARYGARDGDVSKTREEIPRELREDTGGGVAGDRAGGRGQ